MGRHEQVDKEKVNKELEHDMVQGLGDGKQVLGDDMELGMDDMVLEDDKELVRDRLHVAHDILAFLVVGLA